MVDSTQSGLDCLAIGAHPDDCELLAGGTLALAARRGRRVGVLDLTRGEAATRGTPELRAQEADAASKILGLAHRETLNLGDGDIANTQENRRLVVERIRALRPRLVLGYYGEDRHPDHRRAGELVRDAVFFANVGAFAADGERWRVEAMAYFPGNSFRHDEEVDWVVDISPVFELKLEAIRAYSSQVLSTGKGPQTYISSNEFWEFITVRAKLWGHRIAAAYGEPFILDRPPHAGHPLVKLLQAD